MRRTEKRGLPEPGDLPGCGSASREPAEPYRKKVIAFLHPLFQEKVECVLRGLLRAAVDRPGDPLSAQEARM